MSSDGVTVTGRATAEELAAVVAVLRAGGIPAGDAPTAYERWRRTRLAALRRGSPDR
jgi:hypothetical protein